VPICFLQREARRDHPRPWGLLVAAGKSAWSPVQIFWAISIKQGYDQLKIDSYLRNIEPCRCRGKCVGSGRIEKPRAEAVISSIMTASKGISHGLILGFLHDRAIML
jgi:hypothetical protein